MSLSFCKSAFFYLISDPMWMEFEAQRGKKRRQRPGVGRTATVELRSV